MRFLLILAVILASYAYAVCLYLMWPWPLAIPLIAFVARRKAFWSSAHGTARWADEADLRKAGMLGGDGIILGRYECDPPSLFSALRALFDFKNPDGPEMFIRCVRRKSHTIMVRLCTAVHTAVFAPTGAGKNVSIVFPFLLTCKDSVVCVDFKGENAKVTGDTRRKMGQRVVMLDPYRVATQNPDGFNPIDFIDADSPTAIDDCRDLAEMLVHRTGEEKEPHWNVSAQMFIGAVIALVVVIGKPGMRSLQTVKQILSDPESLQMAIRAMIASKAWGGFLSRLGSTLTYFKDRELNSVMTTVNRHLSFLDTPSVAESTKCSTFDPRELTQNMTVYLVLPPDRMKALSPLLRMWVGSLLKACVKNGLQERNKVQFLLDEASSLGKMETINDALVMGRGYGIRMSLIYQSVGQLKECWGENGGDQKLLSNVAQIFFAVNDNDTAKYVSERLGEHTISVESGGSSAGGNSSFTSGSTPSSTSGSSWNSNDNWSQIARKLLKSEEVMALDRQIAITFVPGVAPVWTKLIRYYEETFKEGKFWKWARMSLATAVFLSLSVLLAIVTTAGLNK